MQLNIKPVGPRSRAAILDNKRHCRSLNLPEVSERERPSLAVVGGSPSLWRYRQKLESWVGDIWACGSAFPWCYEQGLDAVFFAIDPLPVMGEYAKKAKDAILATQCDPATFEALRDAKVETFDLFENDEQTNHGVTTATAAPWLAIKMGYRDVWFVGCDSSFVGETHTYKDDRPDDRIVVRVNGADYLTTPGLYLQAQHLARIISTFPDFFACVDGGLLSAMVNAEEGSAADVVATSRPLFDKMVESNPGLTWPELDDFHFGNRVKPPHSAARQGRAAVGAALPDPPEAA